MEKYAISVMGREMYFLYINKLHRENTWLQPVNFGYYKINFFIEVDAQIVIRDARYTPKKYDFVSYPRYTAHYGVLHGVQNVEYFELLIPEDFFDPVDADQKMTEILDRITAKHCFSLPADAKDAFLHRIYGLRDLLRARTHNAHALCRVMDLVFDIEKFSEHPNASERLSKNMSAVLSYIGENLESIASVNALCAALRVSRAYLTGLFHKELGATPYAYLSGVRLEHSLQLLKEGKNVTEACFASGFNSCSVYIEAFKRRFGTTPYKYIKNTTKE